MKHTVTYNHQSQFIEMFGKSECSTSIGSVCKVSSGKSIPKELENKCGNVPYIKVADFNLENNQDYITMSSRYVAPEVASFSKHINVNTVIFAKNGAASMSNKKRLTQFECCIDMNIMAVEIGSEKLKPLYLLYAFHSIDIASLSRQGAVPSISPKAVESLKIPIPPIELQEEFAAIVRQADKSKFDGFKSQFIEMFGDPINNTKNWKISSLKDACVLVSDGPFGSNLKSCHYVQEGVRVIRLQNICQGQFNDTDRAYISNEHYKILKKYTCKPGEIVIATLGEPNLRACIIPDYIKLSINKADCIHVIPKLDLLNPVFVCSYFNSTQVLHLATSDIHGTTRARIAGGQVANFPVLLPPIKLQEEFAAIVRQADKSKYYVQNKLNYICHILTKQIPLRRCS